MLRLISIPNDPKEFMGNVVLGYGEEPSQSELAFAITEPMWNKKYGKESVQAIVKEYASAIVDEGYLLNNKPFKEIVATARPDNKASIRILEGVGMKCFAQKERYGALRNHYRVSLQELRKGPAKKKDDAKSL